MSKIKEKKPFFLKGAPLSLEEIKKIIIYDSISGEMKRKSRNGEWKVISCISNKYLVTCINRKNYRVHRLAWYIYYGSWPHSIIDHINGNPTDNRIENLRIGDFSKNASNRKLDNTNTSGYTGVYLESKTKKWVAMISENGKRKRIGYFNSKQDANKAYVENSKRIYGEFSCSMREDRMEEIV